MRQNTVAQIIDAVCNVGRVQLIHLTGPRQTFWVAKHRQIAMHLGRERTGETAQNIALQLGRKDHTTVLHADRVIAKLREECPDWRKHIEEIVRLLDGTRSENSAVRCPQVARFPLAPNQPKRKSMPKFQKPSSERVNEIKLRVCMTTDCEREFLSKHYGDRRCKRCKARMRVVGGVDERLESATA